MSQYEAWLASWREALHETSEVSPAPASPIKPASPTSPTSPISAYLDDFELPESPVCRLVQSPASRRPARAILIRSARPSVQPPHKDVSADSRRLVVLKCPQCAAVWPLFVGFSAAELLGGEPGGRDLFREVFGEGGFDLSPLLSVREEGLTRKGHVGLPDCVVFWWEGLKCVDEGRLAEARQNCRRALTCLPVGRLAIVLHWQWALLYAREFRQTHSLASRKAHSRELRELRRVQTTFGNAGSRKSCCNVCGRKS